MARQIAIFASCGVGDLPLRRFMSTAGCRSPASTLGTSTFQSGSVLTRSSPAFAWHTRVLLPPGPAARAAAGAAGAAPDAFDLLPLLQPTNTRASFGLAQPVRDSSLVSLDHVLNVQSVQSDADPAWGQFRCEGRGPRSRSIPRFTRERTISWLSPAGFFEPLAMANPAADRRDVGV